MKQADKGGGNCYQDAYNFLVEYPSSDSKLIHGTVYSEGLKRRIGHAWIELCGGDVILDPSYNLCVSVERYHEIGQHETDARYTRQEMLNKAIGTGHFGPWEKE